MAAAFSDSLMASGEEGVSIPPSISKTTKGMTMKFLPDVVIYKEVRNQTRQIYNGPQVVKFISAVRK